MGNLQVYADDCIREAIYEMDELDMDDLRDKAQDQVCDAASNACIYHSECADIIGRYDGEYWQSAEDYLSGKTYKASEWEEARTEYANALAMAVIDDMVRKALDEIAAASFTLYDAAKGIPSFNPAMNPRPSLDCPHGWAPHAYETDDGVMVWKPAELEGCHAVAIKAGPIWLSYTWSAS